MELKSRVGYKNEFVNQIRKGKGKKEMSRKEYLIRKMKREIKREIAIETAAFKKLFPILSGACVMCAGGYAWISFLLGIMH